MSLLHALLGGPPPTDRQQQQQQQQPQLPEQHTEQRHTELPSLCGEPKFKVRGPEEHARLEHLRLLGPATQQHSLAALTPHSTAAAAAASSQLLLQLSLHRRGLRRTPYYAKRKELFARCK
jgi:hypothetical protein